MKAQDAFPLLRARLVQLLGEAAAIDLLAEFAGLTAAIPLDEKYRQRRWAILRMWNGSNASDVAVRYGVSERDVFEAVGTLTPDALADVLRDRASRVAVASPLPPRAAPDGDSNA